ncbi:MAG: OmcA/MtrC family decaheme c-type cytochrome [Candidatus Sulfopaludibacter sp.]|nr:OmcA/MtrC family decaheme c-type cytochrome [Candidatus Sulfopaludibacter sp.]
MKKNKDFVPVSQAGAFPMVTTGVIVKIKSVAIGQDGTLVARFTLTDSQGLGLDVKGVQTPGQEGLGFVAAYIPKGQTQYVAYTTTTTKATSNSNAPQVQAGMDSAGSYALVDPTSGTWDYTFSIKLPANYDATVTHSVGVQVERDLSAYGYPTMFTSNDVYNFVPNGAPVTVTRDVVSEKACNGCHDPLNAHGSPGPRTLMAFCVLCHTPQSTNPDTLNTVDMKVFIHKIHMGSSLPSVVAGGTYQIVHRGSVKDFSTVVFPQDIRNCTTCHASGPAQADNWKTAPSRAVCGSCHDDVNFATGKNHLNLVQQDDNQCAQCHSSKGVQDFDPAIPNAHVIPNYSTSLPGIVLKIVGVTNATAGNAPTVSFVVKDKSGNPVDITKVSSFRMVLAGPNTDYGTGPAGIRVSESPAATATLTAGVYSYTMTNKIPAGATGSYTVSLESTNNVTLLAGTTASQAAVDTAVPVEYYFSVDKSTVVPRRTVVATVNCSACHKDLTIVHGGARGNTQECVECHNPTLTDGTSKQSVSFATQIHSIHRGANLANPYVLGTTNFQSVLFPGDLRDCAKCHVNSSYQVDNVTTTVAVASPGGFTPTTPPISAACQGCHDDKATASHALSNTTSLGEACLACHGNNSEFSVDAVHARQQ